MAQQLMEKAINWCKASLLWKSDPDRGHLKTLPRHLMTTPSAQYRYGLMNVLEAIQTWSPSLTWYACPTDMPIVVLSQGLSILLKTLILPPHILLTGFTMHPLYFMRPISGKVRDTLPGFSHSDSLRTHSMDGIMEAADGSNPSDPTPIYSTPDLEIEEDHHSEASPPISLNRN